MKFKADENLPQAFTDAVREAGFDAMSVWEQNLSGENDLRILSICDAEERCLITFDTDFSDIRTYRPQEHFGIIVLRLHRQDKPYLLQVARRLTGLFSKEDPVRNLWIVDDDRVRIRDGW